MADPLAIALAFALEAVLGWPRWLYHLVGHPVGLAARLIAACDRRFNRIGLPRRTLGIVAQIFLIGAAAGLGLLLQTLLDSHLLLALAAWPTLAARSLDDHLRPILAALRAGDLPAACAALGRIVGRDTHELGEDGIARAAIESLAESLCDGVFAPLFWLAVGGLPLAYAYKAANTADSMVGHIEEPYRAYGWAAARLDDLANLIPARLSALLIVVVAGKGARVLCRDHGQHASPNAGWPEAAMAGALGVRLAGPVRYDGVVYDKPWIGDGVAPGMADLARAILIYRRAWIALAIMTGIGALWFR
ncbi:adenosylcobinamide-phosphate synthase CbiB [Novosphingobium olei]|uniref:adenosylcobinamide-phosphate synthase CbiB n=1 Tax=Novosphingobium olei TaxID=2728851 RepID=UPI00308C5865|nr:adenosylcobinamide-phosphate synthase CbiB [Novosphingobium olei]